MSALEAAASAGWAWAGASFGLLFHHPSYVLQQTTLLSQEPFKSSKKLIVTCSSRKSFSLASGMQSCASATMAMISSSGITYPTPTITF